MRGSSSGGVVVRRWVAGFHRTRSPFSRTGDAVFLAAALTVGLLGAVPLVGYGVGLAGVPTIVGLLFGLVVVGVGYALVALVIGRGPTSVVVATLVTATVSANVPLVPGGSFPVNAGPQVMLVFAPLLLLGAFLVVRREPVSTSAVEVLLGGLAVWALVGVFVARPPEPLIALYFVGYVVVIVVGFGVMRRAVAADLLDRRTVVAVLVVVAVGQALFAVAQFTVQGSFGLSFLGEIARSASKAQAVIGTPVGPMRYGLFVSGLVGGSAPLSVLMTLTVPLAVGYTLDSRRRSRAAVGVVAAVLLLIGLFLTAKESAALGLAAGLFVFVLLWVVGSSARGWRRAMAAGGWLVVAVAGAVGAFWYLRRRLSHSYSETIRLDQYLGGIEMTHDHPWFGVGGANYPYVASEYGLPSHLGGGGLFPIHSQFIGMFAETGVVGGLLFVAAFVVVFLVALRTWWHDASLVNAGIVAAVVGYAVVALFVTPLRYTNVMPFWLLAGAVVAERSRRE